MRAGLRRAGKWALMLFLVLLVAVSIYVGILVFPSPLFAHQARFETFRVYSDEPIPADFAQVIEDTARRLEAMEHAPPRAGQRVSLCNSQDRYAFFAFLARRTPDSLAFGLSVAEVITHEIAHFNSVHALGYRAHLAQPVWKSEGWAEYQANIAALHADPDYDLGERIDQLLQNDYWSRTHSMARDFWEWQLLVEFLGEVKGYTLADLVREDVTKSSAREQMMVWHRLQAERST